MPTEGYLYTLKQLLKYTEMQNPMKLQFKSTLF